MNIPQLATVDVNVPIAANGGATHTSMTCQKACIEMLLGIMRGRRLALDNDGWIFREYLKYLDLSGQPGTGDAFIRWVHDHQWNPDKCVRVTITKLAEGGIAEFPADPALANFDLADRKYASVASVSGATVVNATDTDWRDFSAPFAANGINVLNLCV